MMVTADESGADAEFHDETIRQSTRYAVDHTARFAGWNVNGLRARFDRIVDWIDEREPDVLALQELRCSKLATRHALIAQLRAKTGYDVVAGEHAAIAVSADWTIAHSIDLMADGRAMAANIVGAGEEPTRIISVYAPNGGKAGTAKHRNKLAWFERFTELIQHERIEAAKDDVSLVVLGDLNIARAEIDIWAPERYRRRNLFTPQERAAFAALLDLGLHDVFREIHAGNGLYTWWNQAHDSFARSRGWRLDYALTDAATAARVDHAVIDVVERARSGTSDHAALWIDVMPRA